jgi:cytochrome c-type biogenesis protein CcmH
MKQWRVQALLLGTLCIIVLTWAILVFSLQQHPSLDQQVQSVAEQVKCPICQGESIANSTTTIAFQMRTVAREQLQQGRSEQEVLQYFRDHYGDQIVLTPPWNGFALLAWLMPVGLVLFGLVLLIRILRAWHTDSSAHVSSSPGNQIVVVPFEEAELAAFRAQLEQELAADDTIFRNYRTEAP